MMAAAVHPLELHEERCAACHGHGVTGQLQPACARCHARWNAARFDRYIETYDRGGWLARLVRPNAYQWNVALPCKHPFTCLRYVDVVCPHCRGRGRVAHWQRAREYTPPVHPAHYPPAPPMRSTPILAESSGSYHRERVWDVQRHRYFRTG